MLLSTHVSAQFVNWGRFGSPLSDREKYNQEGMQAYQQGDYRQAERLLVLARQEAEKLGPEDPRLATTLNNLAQVYHAQGKYEEAEPLYQRSLAINEKALGKDHSVVAGDLNNLAQLYHDLGKYDEAEALYTRTLAIIDKGLAEGLLLPEHPYVAGTLNHLAEMYRLQGKYAEAEPIYKRSLATMEKSQGAQSANLVKSLNHLAEMYRLQGKYAEADPL